MGKKKLFRERGKLRLSGYFKKINEGDTICVVREKSVKRAFPLRLIGRSGKVIGQRGSHYITKINDLNKEKIFIIHPVHLKIISDKKSEGKEKSMIKKVKGKKKA